MDSNRKKVKQTCADCIHEYACEMWNVGTLHNADSKHCINFETVKDSAAYLIGYLVGYKEGQKHDG